MDYQSESSFKRTQRDYTTAFILRVVEDVEKGCYTYKQAQKRYGIQGNSTVLKWLRKYGTLDWSTHKVRDMSSKLKTPDQRIKELEAALEQEKQKNLLLTTIIDIAEKQYGLAIEKAFSQTARRLQEEGKMSLSTSCRLFGISRQAIYKQQKVYEQKQIAFSQVKAMVSHQRMSMPRLGTRKLYYMLKRDFEAGNIKIGRDGLFDFLRNEHMLIRPLKSYTKTTWSKHWLHKHSNLAKEMVLDRPEQLWVSDITYIKTKTQNCYLSLVTDAYSRKIMGYHVSEDLKTESVMEALKMAVSDRVYSHKLTHHSDRGIQYCAEPYQQLLRRHGLNCSMTDGYDCYQNALAERVNGIIKHEFLLHTPVDSNQLNKIITQSISIYNRRRPHLSLKMKTPQQIHKEKALADTSTRDIY